MYDQDRVGEQVGMKRPIDMALSLMKMALALLDKAGGDGALAACHLQAAIDAIRCGEPMQDEMPD